MGDSKRIRFDCPHCRKRLSAGNTAGKRVLCPGCGRAIAIPAARLATQPEVSLPESGDLDLASHRLTSGSATFEPGRALNLIAWKSLFHIILSTCVTCGLTFLLLTIGVAVFDPAVSFFLPSVVIALWVSGLLFVVGLIALISIDLDTFSDSRLETGLSRLLAYVVGCMFFFGVGLVASHPAEQISRKVFEVGPGIVGAVILGVGGVLLARLSMRLQKRSIGTTSINPLDFSVGFFSLVLFIHALGLFGLSWALVLNPLHP